MSDNRQKKMHTPPRRLTGTGSLLTLGPPLSVKKELERWRPYSRPAGLTSKVALPCLTNSTFHFSACRAASSMVLDSAADFEEPAESLAAGGRKAQAEKLFGEAPGATRTLIGKSSLYVSLKQHWLPPHLALGLRNQHLGAEGAAQCRVSLSRVYPETIISSPFGPFSLVSQFVLYLRGEPRWGEESVVRLEPICEPVFFFFFPLDANICLCHL